MTKSALAIVLVIGLAWTVAAQTPVEAVQAKLVSIQTEARAVLDRNATLRKKLPPWVTDAMTRIIGYAADALVELQRVVITGTGTVVGCTASTEAELAACASSYTDGGTITVTANITLSSAITFSNGGFTLTAATECGVTLSHNAGSASLLTISRDLTHDTVIKNIRFNEGTSHTDGIYIKITGPAPPATNYNPVLVHDNCFIFTDGALAEGMRVELVGGAIIYSNIFDASGAGNTCAASGGRCDQAINFTADAYTESWTTAHTIGTADTDGLQNTYVETNEFIQFLNQAFDVSANARVVFRYNTMNESAGASHGADTGPHGVRHAEYYNNTFIHVYSGDNPTCNLTFPVSRALNIRGGTAVITANDFSLVETDPCWGNAALNVQLEIQNLRRETTQYPCWGAGNGAYPTYASSVYPAYHQFGRGTYDGSNPLTSTGALDPVYVWSNTASMVLEATDYAPNGCGAGAAVIGTYIQLDRDYYLSARPSYTTYTYPHPLRTP